MAKLVKQICDLQRIYNRQLSERAESTPCPAEDEKDKRIAELEANCDLHRLAAEDEEILRLRAEAERDQLAANLETARKALEAISTQVNDALSCSLVATNTLAQIANPWAVLEERDRAVANRCIEIAKAEHLEDPAPRTSDACDSDAAYDIAIDHVVDAISRKFGLEE